MVELAEGKIDRMDRLSDEKGIIKAAAMDQRGSLYSRLSDALGVEKSDITDGQMEEFKEAVSEVLTPYASALLLDPEWGRPGMRARAEDTGLICSYERSGSNRRYGDVYTYSLPAKTKQLLPDWSVKRAVDLGADAVKLLINYHPDEEGRWLDQKKALVERVGAECAQFGVPFFLEFLGYDLEGGDWKNDVEVAKQKPDVVARSIEEFSKDHYRVDVLKVEIPVNLRFTEGTDAFQGGEAAYSRQQALDHYRRQRRCGRPSDARKPSSGQRGGHRLERRAVRAGHLAGGHRRIRRKRGGGAAGLAGRGRRRQHHPHERHHRRGRHRLVRRLRGA